MSDERQAQPRHYHFDVDSVRHCEIRMVGPFNEPETELLVAWLSLIITQLDRVRYYADKPAHEKDSEPDRQRIEERDA